MIPLLVRVLKKRFDSWTISLWNVRMNFFLFSCSCHVLNLFKYMFPMIFPRFLMNSPWCSSSSQNVPKGVPNSTSFYLIFLAQREGTISWMILIAMFGWKQWKGNSVGNKNSRLPNYKPFKMESFHGSCWT